MPRRHSIFSAYIPCWPVQGEMAQFALDQAMDAMEMDPDELEQEDGPTNPVSTKTCRACGKTDLHWEDRAGKWRLCDERGVHVCPVKPLPKS